MELKDRKTWYSFSKKLSPQIIALGQGNSIKITQLLWYRTDLLKLALKRESSLLPYCYIREEENLIPLWSNLKGELVCWAGQNMLIWFMDVISGMTSRHTPWFVVSVLNLQQVSSDPPSSYWGHEPVWVSSLLKKNPRVTAEKPKIMGGI